MFKISKQFHFSAGHALIQLPTTHKCHRPHGHNYIVELVLGREELDGSSFVVDYGDLKSFQQYLDASVDHRFLTSSPDEFPDWPPDWVCNIEAVTTAENLAKRFADVIRVMPRMMPWGQYLLKVRVSETPKTWAEYIVTRTEVDYKKEYEGSHE